MSTESNVFSQGGGGTIFEISVQTAYYITFLLGGQVPGLPESHITYFRQQSGSLGYGTDDLLLRCENEATTHRVLMQVKHLITITADNKIFTDVLTAAWRDFNNSALFDPVTDKIYLVSSGLPMVVKNHLLPVLAWAKAKNDGADFLNEVTRIDAKKKYYDLFKTIIAATTPTVSDDEMFRFFKCYEVLDYDLDQPASVTKAAILSSLTLAKDTPHSAASIWNDVFNMLAGDDSRGGQWDLASRPTDIMAKLKSGYYSTTQKDLFRLSASSQELLEVITDKIGSCHLDRTDLLTAAIEKLSGAQVLLITGDAGAGKSALAKALIRELSRNTTGYVLAFKSDELLRGPLRNWFSAQGVHQSLKEIFSHFALLPNGVVYVDSMERLLEEEATAFQQILHGLSQLPSIKLVGTCRKSLLNLIHTKFFTNIAYSEQDVPYLSKVELDLLCSKVPALRPAVDNEELQQLVRIPKYLDFAHRAIQNGGGDYHTMSEAKFQEVLWSTIVENVLDAGTPGMPMRRSKSFIDIAVVRSRKMQLYVQPTEPADAEALGALQRETVLLQQETSPFFAPAHDVLEDWALARYTDNLFSATSVGTDFFTTLGTEPAMRRAYRLWVQLALKQQDARKIAFFTGNLTDTTLDRFWHIESLVAVLSSARCEAFLQDHLALLKANDWALLFLVIHIMRTACRVNGCYLDRKVLVPEGSSWAAVLKILQEDKTGIPVKYYPTLEAILQDWKLEVLTKPNLPTATRDAGLLTQFLLKRFLVSGGRIYSRDKQLERLVKLLFPFAGGITTELRAEFDRAPGLLELDRTVAGNNPLRIYGGILLDQALMGPDAAQLARYLPDVIFELATKRWYRMPRPQLEGMEEMMAKITESSQLDQNFRFGLAGVDRFGSTESSLSTPVYWLLQYHADRALDFVIALFNHATAHYKDNAFPGDPITTITLHLQDGTTRAQTASPVLWAMFRAYNGYGNPLLNSILMAIEKYLLSIGAQGEQQGEHFRHCLSVLLTQSTTVATTAVVASAVQAYPLMAAAWMLVLLDQKDFYNWDISRYTHDLETPFLFQDGSLDVQERTASHFLLHRTQYDAGLRGFVIHYWVTIGVYNVRIAEMIDRLLAAADPADLDWRKTLEHIDGRRLVLGKEVEIKGKPGFMVQTNFSPEVATMVEEFRVQHEKDQAERAQTIELKNAFDKKTPITLERWTQIQEHYKGITEFNTLRHAPGLLAAVGIRDLWAKLNDEQRKECIGIVGQLSDAFAIAGFTHHQLGQLNTSPYDTPAVLEVLPLLLSNPNINAHADDRYQVEELIFRVLVAYYEDNILDYNKFVKALHLHLWPAHPDLAFKMWQGALALEGREDKLPAQQSYENYEAYLDAVYAFLSDYYKKVRVGQVSVDIQKVELTTFNKWALARAIRHIPGQAPPEAVLAFLARILTAYVKHHTDAARQDEDNYHEIGDPLQDKLAQIFFESALGPGPALMDYFCKLLITKPVLAALRRDGNDLFSFFMDTMKQTIFKTDEAMKQDASTHERTVQLFQAMWKAFDITSTQMQRAAYWSTILLNIDWRPSARDWAPISGMKEFFIRYVDTSTAMFPAAAVNLVATIGDQELLPEALVPLVAGLKKAGLLSDFNLYTDTKAELLIHRIYDFHLEEVRKDPGLMESYRWLLERLIDLGSTNAYWLNEFVISYHRQQHE